MLNEHNDPGWFVSNDYPGDGFCIANPDLDVSVYVEERTEEREPYGTEYTVYGVGIHDRTIAAHPTIPGTMYDEPTFLKALCRLFELIQNLDIHLHEMRTSEAYRRAIEVKEAAPDTREEGGMVPGSAVRNREGKAYSGRRDPEELIEELHGEVLEKHRERKREREAD